MGTRADFYVGRGPEAEWLGSVAFDGYPDGFPNRHGAPIDIKTARTERDFRVWVEAELRGRDDATTPEGGWPWPWEDSRTTDYAYAFDDGQVWGSCFGGEWFKADEPQPEDDDDGPRVKVANFPNMKDRQNVTYGRRSGLLIVRSPRTIAAGSDSDRSPTPADSRKSLEGRND